LIEYTSNYAKFDYIAEYRDEEFEEQHGFTYHSRKLEEEVASGLYDLKRAARLAKKAARKAERESKNQYRKRIG
jgi:hypothetical protein